MSSAEQLPIGAGSESPMRMGWCPGALRPMMSGDGLIVRLRLSSNAFTPDSGLLLSRLARRYGNGLLDVSQRANIQLRGVTNEALPDLQKALSAAQLIDDDPAVESIRNIMVSPLAGLDPAATDVADIIADLEDLLRSDTQLRSLPGKFGFAIDAGGLMPLGETVSDITLRFQSNDGGVDGGDGLILLSGCRDTAVRVPRSSVVSALRALALVFLEAFSERSDRPAEGSPGHVRRMRDLVGKKSAEAIFQRAGLVPTPYVLSHSDVCGPGIHQMGRDLSACVIGVPFGSLDADQLDALSTSAKSAGGSTLRLSPDRTIVIPVVASAAEDILQIAKSQGLIVAQDDARLLIDACPGAPACARGETRVREDARQLAESLQRFSAAGEIAQHSIHMSGCKKGCARRAAAPLTLVGDNGAYNLVRDGSVSDAAHITGLAPGELSATVLSAVGTTSDNKA